MVRYGIILANLGAYADPRAVARVASAAEESGWDGLFVWDHLGFVWDGPAGDPWVLLAAAAVATERLRLGTAVTPLPRRRPYVVANTVATLDVMTEGRMVLGVGIGGMSDAREEFTRFGESADPRHKAEMLDEALEVVTRLWSGELVSFRGRHYTVDDVRLAPVPVQRPRVPVWVGGLSGPALRRAARWDGWVVEFGDGEVVAGRNAPEDLAAKLETIRRHRAGDGPFEVALGGRSEPGDVALVRTYEEIGATWWIESINGRRGTTEAMLDRIRSGPPR